MKRRQRGNHTASFRPKVPLAALKDDRTLNDLAQQFEIDPKRSQDCAVRFTNCYGLP